MREFVVIKGKLDFWKLGKTFTSLGVALECCLIFLEFLLVFFPPKIILGHEHKLQT